MPSVPQFVWGTGQHTGTRHPSAAAILPVVPRRSLTVMVHNTAATPHPEPRHCRTAALKYRRSGGLGGVRAARLGMAQAPLTLPAPGRENIAL